MKLLNFSSPNERSLDQLSVSFRPYFTVLILVSLSWMNSSISLNKEMFVS